MTDKKIQFAIVGFGHIGKRYANIIAQDMECELAAVIDVKPREALQLPHSGIPFFQSLYAFLQSGTACDVVIIASPNGLHAEQSLQCLDQKKHIVVEKPMAIKKVDAEAIISKALHVHKHVFAVMQNRYSPPSKWLKELLSSGKLGKIFMVHINCYWNRDSRYYKKGETWHGTNDLDGGTLFTQFSHFIDIMYWLFGDIENIQGRFYNFNHQHLTNFEDSGSLIFDFCNGGMGTFHFSTACWDKNLESSLTVIAENGSLKVGGQYMNEVEYCHIKDYQMPILAPTNAGTNYGPYKVSAANHHCVIRNVIDVLKNRDTINTTALEGLKVVDIIERMYQIRNQQFSKKS